MDERTKRQLARGRELYHAGNHPRALRALAPLAKERLPFADVYAMLGTIFHQMGKLPEARTMFEEALRLNPRYTEAALNLVLTYNELGRYQDAKHTHERMLAHRRGTGAAERLDPFVKGKIANMHADVAQAYEQAGLYEEAAQEYRRALALCPQYVDLRSRLGVSLRASGDLGNAEREFQRAKRENPNLVAVRLQLGMTYYSAGRRTDAAREWREALAMEPDNRFAKLYLRLVTPERRRRGSIYS